MVKTPYYCRENQPEEEALKIMLDLGLPYLPVLDSNLRVVGVVSMEDLMREEEKRPSRIREIEEFQSAIRSRCSHRRKSVVRIAISWR